MQRRTYHEVIPIERPAVAPNYVGVDLTPPSTKARRGEVLPPSPGEYTVRAPQGATQHIELRTSMVDRALGHLITNVSMLFVFSWIVPIAKAVVFQSPVTALSALTLWFMTFAVLWAGTWIVALVISPEGIGLLSELLKWKLLFREQTYRWQHWERMNRDDR